jgi:hypothetical protein
MANRISHRRIFEVALAHGWDGHTVAARAAARAAAANTNAATTVVTPIARLAAAFGASATSATPFFLPIPLAQADLHPIPWLVPGLLIRGDITVLAGQGGGAKTALAVAMAVALAAGLRQVGPFAVNKPAALRGAYISAEEDANRLGLLIAAACSIVALNGTERAQVQRNLVCHDAAASGWRLGEPRPGHREEIAPEAEDRALNQLAAALAGVDLLILDTLAALLALTNENDNSAATILMRRLGRAARQANCAVMLIHHTPKMTREMAALQRGEVTLIRGGSAIVNTARVVLTITSPTAAEAGQFIMQGLQPDRVRRLEHAKLNDAAPMEPAYFALRSEPVKVHDGSEVAVRAVEFIAPPAVGAAGISDAVRSVVMKAVDAGTVDDHGHKVPLSPGGGRDNRRDAIPNIARALMNANSGLTEPQAKALAREALKDLRDRIGCVVEQDVQMPQYKAAGQPNGTKPRRGLVARWDLAPWANAFATTATVGASEPASGAEASQ